VYCNFFPANTVRYTALATLEALVVPPVGETILKMVEAEKDEYDYLFKSKNLTCAQPSI
jgi:hypothetical protein